MLNLDHKRLEVWQTSVELAVAVYELTESYPKSEMYGLTSQLRRASVSVPSNIAEGASRSSARERRRFHEISRSSLVEMDTELELSKKLGYCTDGDLSGPAKKMNQVFAMLSRLIERTGD